MFFGQMGLVIEAGQQQEPSSQASTRLERNPTFADTVDKGNISARSGNTITPRTEALCSNVGLQAKTDATPRKWGSAISESVLGTPRDAPPNSAQRGAVPPHHSALSPRHLHITGATFLAAGLIGQISAPRWEGGGGERR